MCSLEGLSIFVTRKFFFKIWFWWVRGGCGKGDWYTSKVGTADDEFNHCWLVSDFPGVSRSRTSRSLGVIRSLFCVTYCEVSSVSSRDHMSTSRKQINIAYQCATDSEMLWKPKRASLHRKLQANWLSWSPKLLCSPVLVFFWWNNNFAMNGVFGLVVS